jgi:hypothetical protein
MSGREMASGLGTAIFAVVFLILAALFFSPILTELLTRPFCRLIDSVYFGNDDREAPPVTMTLIHSYRRELRFDDAIAECYRQLEYHPDSPELWHELVSTVRESGDFKEAERLSQKAGQRLKSFTVGCFV